MEKASRLSQMAQLMKVSGRMERCGAWGSTLTQTVTSMRANSSKTRPMAKVKWFTRMEMNMMAIGLKISSMGKVSLLTPTSLFTLVSSKRARKMDTAFRLGQTTPATWATGRIIILI
jgi:hypothetical protein